MQYHILVKGFSFFNHISHKDGMHMSLKIYWKYKTGKMKHAYNEVKSPLIILKKMPNSGVSWTELDHEIILRLVPYFGRNDACMLPNHIFASPGRTKF